MKRGFVHLKQRAGVTLIELLVVTLIMSTVLGVVGASLMSGIRVWDTARSFHDHQAPLAIGVDTLARDVMNATPCYAIPWQGEATAMTLPTLIPGSVTGNESSPVSPSRIGQVRYYMDTANHWLMRKAWAYPGTEPAVGEQLITGVSLATFEYQGASDEGAEGWSASWVSKSNQPSAVRVTLEVTRGESQPVTCQRIIVPWMENL